MAEGLVRLPARGLCVFLLAMGLSVSLAACGPRSGVSGEEEPKDTLAQEEKSDQPEANGGEKPGKEEPEKGNPDSKISSKEWERGKYTLMDQITGIEGWQQFCQKTLVGEAKASGDGNWIYCPINLYRSLAMLTEISQGDTRTQITDLLGVKKQEKLRTPYIGYPKNCIKIKGIADEFAMADSLWLNQLFPYSKEKLKILRRNHGVSLHQGKMGKEMDEKIQKWLNEVTRNRLKEQVSRIETQDSDVMRMYSTLYLEQQWHTPFDKDRTKEEVFHGKAYNTCGNISEEERWEDTTCEYLYRDMTTWAVKTDQYMSVNLPFQNTNMNMRIVLPEVGVELEELCTGKSFWDLLNLCAEDGILCIEEGKPHDKYTEYAKVEFSMPKFDITSDVNLENVLSPLGVTDMFEADKADFLSLLDKVDMISCPPIYVGAMQQTTNMKIDENGCTVASYTETALEAGAIADEPEKTYKMHCDRPFLFFITYEGQVLCAGGVQSVD